MNKTIDLYLKELDTIKENVEFIKCQLSDMTDLKK